MQKIALIVLSLILFSCAKKPSYSSDRHSPQPDHQSQSPSTVDLDTLPYQPFPSFGGMRVDMIDVFEYPSRFNRKLFGVELGQSTLRTQHNLATGQYSKTVTVSDFTTLKDALATNEGQGVIINVTSEIEVLETLEFSGWFLIRSDSGNGRLKFNGGTMKTNPATRSHCGEQFNSLRFELPLDNPRIVSEERLHIVFTKKITGTAYIDLNDDLLGFYGGWPANQILFSYPESETLESVELEKQGDVAIIIQNASVNGFTNTFSSPMVRYQQASFSPASYGPVCIAGMPDQHIDADINQDNCEGWIRVVNEYIQCSEPNWEEE